MVKSTGGLQAPDMVMSCITSWNASGGVCRMEFADGGIISLGQLALRSRTVNHRCSVACYRPTRRGGGNLRCALKNPISINRSGKLLAIAAFLAVVGNVG